MPRFSGAQERLLAAAMELIWTHSYGSTSVDAICARAKVKKGSFYYFFSSKSDLAVAAIDAAWQTKKLENDRIFSPTNPPLDRLRLYFEVGYRTQAELKAKVGFVLGCPLFSLGCELSTQDEAIRTKVLEVININIKYLETTIRDAQAEGFIPVSDVAAKARQLFAYCEGVLAQARIENNLELVRSLGANAMDLLGASSQTPREAA